MATMHPQQHPPPSLHRDISKKAQVPPRSYPAPPVSPLDSFLCPLIFICATATSTASKDRSLLWSRLHCSTKCTLHHASLCMSPIPPTIHPFAGETPVFYCLCSPPYEAAP